MKEKMGKFLLFILTVVFLCGMLVINYKIKEFKLNKIWGIENPTFFQVLDSYNNGKSK